MTESLVSVQICRIFCAISLRLLLVVEKTVFSNPLSIISHTTATAATHQSSLTLCQPTHHPDLVLTDSGFESTAIILFPSGDGDVDIPKEPCEIRVIAPQTHVINMQFVPSVVQRDARTQDDPVRNGDSNKRNGCFMNIFLAENPDQAVWMGDLCTADAKLSAIDLLTPNIRIVWFRDQHQRLQVHGKFILTAVGQGRVCLQPDQFACMRIGWEPLLCISRQLQCDGIDNCPNQKANRAAANDENEQMCASHLFAERQTWEQVAIEIFRSMESPALVTTGNNSDNTNERKGHDSKFNSWQKWQDLQMSNLSDIFYGAGHSSPPRSRGDPMQPAEKSPFGRFLTKYAPWGYLLLGMFICSVILMCCGVCECCLRKKKYENHSLQQHSNHRNQLSRMYTSDRGNGASSDSRLLHSSSSSAPTNSTATTLLIVNRQPNGLNLNYLPPNYEDLEQPPKYCLLYPGDKKEDSDNSVEEV